MQRPNDSQLEGLLLDALPPLHRQVRRNVARGLAQRLERAGLPPLAAAGPEAGAGLLPAVQELLERLQAQVAEVEDQAARLTRDHAAAADDAARRAVLLVHLEETVEDARARREDVRALKRWMGFDALRERLERRRHALLVEHETALRCAAGLVRAGPLPSATGLVPLARLLLIQAMQGARPQARSAALEALGGLLERRPELARALPDAEPALTSLAGAEDAGPFLQAEALHVLLRTDLEAGLTLLRQRLRQPLATRRDFLFRRQALEVAVRVLPPEQVLPMVELASRNDPSEWVRLGLGALALRLPGGTPVLLRLAGLLPDGPEASHRVRMSAVVAAASALRGEAAAGLGGADAARLLAGVLRRDAHPLVLRLACEQVAELAGLRADPAFAAERPALQAALTALRLAPTTPGPVLEAAAVASQALAREADPVRRAWTAHLAQALAGVPEGGRVALRVDPAPDGLPPLPDDAAWLGAVLADLSAGGLGLCARLRGGQLTLWRGDVWGRRAWRVLHEAGRLAPNKRQGFLHTIGRVLPGPLRAHPGRLEEITATQVPGERVHVAQEGGWGRHLPTADDLLDLPLGSGEPVSVFSSHGVTTLTPPRSLGARLRAQLRVTREYARYARLRLDALGGTEPRERRRYVEAVESELGVQVRFTPWESGEAVPHALATLFGDPRRADAAPPPPHDVRAGVALAAAAGLGGAVDGSWLDLFTDRVADGQGYFEGAGGNGVLALGLITAGLLTAFLVSAYRQRQEVARLRAQVPLCVGGWGTRGKSGTERLKAALFGGLGFDVFAKTTGSEAMFVHSAPGGTPSEFFIYRPYDKATIWEQRDMLRLGVQLGTDVFLWECMALQPAFVELLQNDWMHDDVATLTNAYPDHEDIQGPAGIDVARVITNFMPRDGKVATTEDHFLPLFHEEARKKGTELQHSPWWEAELIPEELLAQFPYREHPRNMALVATLGEGLGVSRAQALALMAEHVQPEIGVLKVFPPARVRGRTLTFINGHSANERTGFLNNWVRTGLDRVDPELAPDRAVLTVVNNRWDRVARSEVFARILVEDAAADRHVLIGTNLEGLQKYVRDALAAHLARTEVVAAEDLAPGGAAHRPAERLARALARLKVPRPATATFLDRAARWARGAGLALQPTDALVRAVDAALSGDGEGESVAEVRKAVADTVGAALAASLVTDAPPPADAALPETLAPATAEDVVHHALYLLARMAVHARLLRALPRPGDAGEALDAFHTRFREAYTELFLEQLVPVSDSKASGDQVVEACARCVPPGAQVSIMGAQNIKGTGLDWVYRWVALDKVRTALEALRTGPADARRRAAEVLEAFEDSGVVDAGLAASVLPGLAASAETDEEAERLQRLADRYAATHAARVGALQHTREAGRLERLAARLEKTFDYLDSVQRRRISEQLLADLVAGRVSHARAAVETRKLYERQKGGWLLAGLSWRKDAVVQAVRPHRALPSRPRTTAELRGAGAALPGRNTVAPRAEGPPARTTGRTAEPAATPGAPPDTGAGTTPDEPV